MESLLSFIVFIIVGIVSYKLAPKNQKQNKKPDKRTEEPRPAPQPAPQVVPQMASVKVPTVPGVIDSTDVMPAVVPDGDSRECDHGSVGGSMDITTHEGLEDEFEHAQQKVKTQVKTQVATQVKVNVKPHAGSVPEQAVETKAGTRKWDPARMREAVVMAEILKRPAERAAMRRGAGR